MSLSSKQKQVLKGQAHRLNPTVMVGHQGFTAAVKKELDLALTTHELIKVRVASTERDVRKAVLAEMCEATGAALLQVIGQIGVLYRKNQS